MTGLGMLTLSGETAAAEVACLLDFQHACTYVSKCCQVASVVFDIQWQMQWL